MKTIFFGSEFDNGLTKQISKEDIENDWDAWEETDNRRFFQEQIAKQAKQEELVRKHPAPKQELDMPAVCVNCERNATCKKTWAKLCEEERGV